MDKESEVRVSSIEDVEYEVHIRHMTLFSVLTLIRKSDGMKIYTTCEEKNIPEKEKKLAKRLLVQ